MRDAVVGRLHRVQFVRAIGRRLLRGRGVRQPFHGGVLCLDAVEHSWAWTGSVRLEHWDRPLQDRLLALSRSCRTLLDVGANVGVMSLSVALRNRDIRIIAIEPNRRAAALLRRAIALNRLGAKVTVVEAVAGERDGDARFEEGGSTTGHVSTSGTAWRRQVDLRRLIAETVSDGPVLMKMDVEGFEAVLVPILCAAPDRTRVILVVELHALGFNAVGDPAACTKALADSGASIARLDGERISDLEPWTDPIATTQIVASWTS